MPRDVRYIAAGVHEHGHARNHETSRYPRLRAAATSLGDSAGLIGGIGAGLAGRGRYGAMGGLMIGSGVSALGSVPTLIEEHQASQNALKAMKASGEFTPKEYSEAKSALREAYKSYITSALQRSALAGGVSSGNAGLMVGMIGGGALAGNHRGQRLRERFKNTRGTRRDEAVVKRIAGQMGSKATHSYMKQPKDMIAAAYAVPHSAVAPLVSREEYKKMLESRVEGQLAKNTLERGGVFIPKPQERR